MSYWLMKSEPDEVSINDLARLGQVPWFGVRNYQARNFMRDAMQVGDGVLFYHSSCATPGIAGLARVASLPYPDATQFNPASPYFDAKSTPDRPRWVNVDVAHVATTPLIPLATLRQSQALAGMGILQKGSRLSITPVTAAEWQFITRNLMELHDVF